MRDCWLAQGDAGGWYGPGYWRGPWGWWGGGSFWAVALVVIEDLLPAPEPGLALVATRGCAVAGAADRARTLALAPPPPLVALTRELAQYSRPITPASTKMAMITRAQMPTPMAITEDKVGTHFARNVQIPRPIRSTGSASPISASNGNRCPGMNE